MVAELASLRTHELPMAVARLARTCRDATPSDWDKVMQLLRKHVPAMSPSAVAATLNAVPRVKAKGKKQLFLDLAERVEPEVQKLTHDELARATSGLVISQAVKANHSSLRVLYAECVARRSEFEASSTVQVLNAFTKVRLGGGADGLVAAFSPQVREWMPEFYPMEMALAANAYSRVVVKDPEMFGELAEKISMSMSDLNNQDVATVANAFAKVQAVECRSLFTKLAATVKYRMQEFRSHHLVEVAWAFSRVRHSESAPLLEAIASHMHEIGNLDRFVAKELVNLLSAFATIRIRHQLFIGDVHAHLGQRPEFVRAMSAFDLLYTASSLARLDAGHPTVFALIGEAVLASRLPSPKQAVYLLHSFSRVQCVHTELFAAITPHLHASLNDKGLSTSDQVVAICAYVNAGLHTSPEAQALCSDIITDCCEPDDQGLSALDTSLLLRALARAGGHGWSTSAVQHLVARTVAAHEQFSNTDFLMAVHAAVQIYADGPGRSKGIEPRDNLFNALMTLAVGELGSGGRLSRLAPSELMTAANVIARAGGHSGYAEANAWASITNQLVRLLDESLASPSEPRCSDDRSSVVDCVNSDGAVAAKVQQEGGGVQSELLACIVVVMNCCSRACFRDCGMFISVYSWLSRSCGSLTDPAEQASLSYLVASFAKLGAASQAEASGAGVPVQDFERTWTWILTSPSPCASHVELALFLNGLAHAIAGASTRSVPLWFRKALVAAASSRLCAMLPHFEARDTGVGIKDATDADMLASCSQALAALQCLSLLGDWLAARPLRELSTLSAALAAFSPAILARGTSTNRKESPLAMEVTDVVEGFCTEAGATGFSRDVLPVLKVENPVAQYFIDITISPLQASAVRSSAQVQQAV